MNEININKRIEELSQSIDNPKKILNLQLIGSKPEEKIASLLSDSNDKSEIFSVSLTIGDLIYDVVRIDPEVVNAIDFSREADLSDFFKFSIYADKLTNKNFSAFEGNIHNLKGYVGERFVAQQLQSEGMEVEFPEDPNQEGYDLLVNGDPFQVKCVSDPKEVFEHLEKNPDIPVFVNQEIMESVHDVENVYPVSSFSLETIEESTRETIEAGDDILDYEIPLIALSVAVGKNVYSILNNQTDVKHGAINVLYDLIGGISGGNVGSSSLAIFGSLLGPYGVVVGGLVGAIGGATYGRKLISKAKKIIHTSKEEQNLEIALEKFVKQSINSSKKSNDIFDKKITSIKNNFYINNNGTEFLKEYCDSRIKEENKYFNDKLKQFTKSKKNIYLLDPINEDILTASLNAITLSIRAKVHPSSIKQAMDNLINAMQALQEKRSKLLAI